MNRLPVAWLDDRVKILDQSRLPGEEVYLETDDYGEVIAAIASLKVRGAPAIGVAAAYGLALGARRIKAETKEEFLNEFREISRAMASARPTARNLFHTLERLERVATAGEKVSEIREALVAEAVRIHAEETAATERLSQLGADLIGDGFTVLTHCNAGPLATAGYGTALGAIIRAKEQGKKPKVYATETRPLLQGARLTTWELKEAGVPVTLITDAMAGYFMQCGEVSCVMVGADRIAANGDTANKIGTYTLAVLARENDIPFYVAAPTSTIDLSLKTGVEIPIEERDPAEVTHIQGVSIAPASTEARNPAFDVTPHHYLTAIITERGIIREPFGEGLKAVFGELKHD